MRQVNWGIIGLGKIATKFAESFKNTKNSKLKAVASKDISKIEKFQSTFDLNKEFCFSNYESILNCDSEPICPDPMCGWLCPQTS